MNQKTIAIIIALASIVLVATASTTANPLAIFAQSESEGPPSEINTDVHTDVQVNLCSGYAVCTNGAACSGFEVCTNGAGSNEDPLEDAQTLIATPN
jgi:hypothetical protein